MAERNITKPRFPEQSGSSNKKDTWNPLNPMLNFSDVVPMVQTDSKKRKIQGKIPQAHQPIPKKKTTTPGLSEKTANSHMFEFTDLSRGCSNS